MPVTVAMTVSIEWRSEIRNPGRRPRRHCLFGAGALLNRRLPRRIVVEGRSAPRVDGAFEAQTRGGSDGKAVGIAEQALQGDVLQALRS
jgi:hypothetical protein